jgi:non-specific serine/threonine protein kinase
MELTGSANGLAPDTQIREYHLQGVLGEGGFGIVYRAYDTGLDRTVAIKEYMPCALASRGASHQIQVIPQHREAFEAGLRSFLNEARLLAKFSHPALVHVYRFFEENGTAYMVMRYYEGQTFRAFLVGQQQSMDERWLKAMLTPILDGLEMLHAADCYHRDIAPDNVFLSVSGMPVLLDFGAARRIIGDMTQALTTVLKPGFAPIEQYADDGAMPQGAWTDIYQLGAMLYRAITGKVPATSVARMINDPIRELTLTQYPGYSAQFLRGVHQALSVRPADRPQSILEFKSLLGVEGFTASSFSAWSASDAGPFDMLARTQDATAPSLSLGAPLHRPAANAQADVSEVTTVRLADSLINAADKELVTLPATQENNVRGSAPPIARPEPPTQTLPLPKSPVFLAKEPTVDDGVGQGRWQPPAVQGVSVHQDQASAAPTASTTTNNPIFWKLAALTAAAMLLLAGVWYLFGGRPPSNEPTPSVVHQQSWEAAKKAGTVASLRAYLAAYPAGEHAAEARATLDRLMTPPAAPAVLDKPMGPTATPSSAPPVAEVSVKPNVGAPTAPTPDPRSDVRVKPTNANTSPPLVVTRPRPEVTKPDVPTVSLSDNRPAAPVETGTVALKVTPWGNVRVNRSPVGSSPPLTQLNLPEGQYQIEISNPNGSSVTKVVQVTKGEVVVLSHKFD